MKLAAAALLSIVTLIAPAAARQPAAPAAVPANDAAIQAATAAAASWLVLADAGNYADSWSQGASAFRGAVTQPQWTAALGSVRAPLGAVKSRKLVSNQFTRTLPGAPEGEYVVLQYQTEFANRSGIETVVPMREQDGSWKVSGYFIQ